MKLLALLIAFTSTVYAQTCISLEGSKECGPFASMEVSSTDVFSTVQEFDTFIASHKDSNPSYIADFKTRYGCPQFEGKGHRFHISYYCALHVDTATTKGCNISRPQLKVCPPTAKESTDSLFATFNNPAICSSTPTAERTRYMDLHSRYNTGITNGAAECVTGLSAELAQCGFSSTSEATAYCAANPTAPCCKGLGNMTIPTITKVTSQASSSTSSNTGMLIGLGVAGFFVLLFIIFIIMFIIRRNKQKKLENGMYAGDSEDPIQIAETFEVIYNYVPNLSDEVYLYVGDKIIVKCKFDDGWALGYNMSTKQEGSFPMACVDTLYNDKRSTYKYESMPADSNSIRQRGSSLYVPKY